MYMSGRRLGVAMLGAVLACDRPAPSRANDTVEGPAPPPPVVDKPITGTPWDTELGTAFLVVSAVVEQGAVVFPMFDSTSSLDTANVDTRTVQMQPFDLFANGRRIGSAKVGDAVDSDVPDDCTSWPIVRLQVLNDSAERGWVVGVARDRVVPFTTDSLGGISVADSGRLTVEVARVASAAPGDTVLALRGTPFQVRRAYVVTPLGGASFVVAEVIRSLNQEAMPVQEHLLVIATRDATTSRLSLAYIERTAGHEESLEATELLLAGATAAAGTQFLLLARYIADGVIYSLLEAPRDGRRRSRWTSTYAGC
jgi:hypothetical protein